MKTPVQVRDELEAENKALRERAESAEASFNQRDLQMRSALEETESMFQRTQRAETNNIELRERLEKAEAACAEMRECLNEIKVRIAYIGMPQESFWMDGERKIWDWRKQIALLEHALSSDCGQPLLDKLKAMEEILKDCQHLRSQVFPLACFPECPACRLKAMKKVKP